VKAIQVVLLIGLTLCWPVIGTGQSLADMATLVQPRTLELSPDGSLLWYQVGQTWWQLATASSAPPVRLDKHDSPAAAAPVQVPGSRTAAGVRRSPDGRKIAYLDNDPSDNGRGPTYLFSIPEQGARGDRRPVARIPMLAFRWDDSSEYFWVIAGDGSDEPIGRLTLDGRFERITKHPGLRRRGGFAAANGVVARVQSDGARLGAIWIRDRSGRVHLRWDQSSNCEMESRATAGVPVEERTLIVDDVMSGVNELIRRGIADPDRLFLYGYSNGASAVDQLLAQTHVFRAAVSGSGVADWLVWYRERFDTAAEFVATFLGGRRPGDSPDLYRRISPFYSPEKITTPLLLTVGDKDTRYADNLRFYEALRAAGANVTFIAFPGEAHELGRAAVEQYVQKALEFFRSASQGK